MKQTFHLLSNHPKTPSKPSRLRYGGVGHYCRSRRDVPLSILPCQAPHMSRDRVLIKCQNKNKKMSKYKKV